MIRGAVVFIGFVRPARYFPINNNFFKYITLFNENYGTAFYKAKCDYLKSVQNGSWIEIEDEYDTIWNTINIGYYGDPATKMTI